MFQQSIDSNRHSLHFMGTQCVLTLLYYRTFANSLTRGSLIILAVMLYIIPSMVGHWLAVRMCGRMDKEMNPNSRVGRKTVRSGADSMAGSTVFGQDLLQKCTSGSPSSKFQLLIF